MKLNGAIFLEVALGVVTQRQTPCVTISRTTANKTTIQKRNGNKMDSQRTPLWRILRYKQIIDKVSLKLHTKRFPRPFS